MADKVDIIFHPRNFHGNRHARGIACAGPYVPRRTFAVVFGLTLLIFSLLIWAHSARAAADGTPSTGATPSATARTAATVSPTPEPTPLYYCPSVPQCPACVCECPQYIRPERGCCS